MRSRRCLSALAAGLLFATLVLLAAAFLPAACADDCGRDCGGCGDCALCLPGAWVAPPPALGPAAAGDRTPLASSRMRSTDRARVIEHVPLRFAA